MGGTEALQADLEVHLAAYERWRDRLDSHGRPESAGHETVYDDTLECATGALDVGATLLGLDRPTEAAAWFRTAADHYVDLAQVHTTVGNELSERRVQAIPQRYLRGLQAAVLGDDPAVRAAMVAATRVLGEWYGSVAGDVDLVPLDRARAFAEVVASVDDTARGGRPADGGLDGRSTRERVSSLPADGSAPTTALRTGCLGVLGGDRSALADGLREWVVHHQRTRATDQGGLDALALGPASLVVLARRSGIDVTVDHAVVPAGVTDLA